MSAPVPIVSEPVTETHPVSPTEETITSTENPQPIDITSEQKGPFCSLADQASESQLGQRLKTQFPQATNKLSSMHEVLVTVDKGVYTTREVMATNEGRRLSAALIELVMSLCAFASMILAKIFNKIESYLDIPVEEESSGTLSSRFCKIVSTVGQKICTKASARENEVRGTSEEQIFVYARLVTTFMFNAFMCMLSGLLRFNGPGKEYVVPIAEKVVRLMPPSLEASVKETDGPVTVVKKCMEHRNGCGIEGDKTE